MFGAADCEARVAHRALMQQQQLLFSDSNASLDNFVHNALLHATSTLSQPGDFQILVNEHAAAIAGAPSMRTRFEAARERALTTHGNCQTLLCFHGTPSQNISSICEHGLDPARRGTHMGQKLGPGEYCTTSLAIAHSYCRGGRDIIVCEVLRAATTIMNLASGDEIYVISQDDMPHALPVAKVCLSEGLALSIHAEYMKREAHYFSQSSGHSRVSSSVAGASLSGAAARGCTPAAYTPSARNQSDTEFVEQLMLLIATEDLQGASTLYRSHETVVAGGRPSFAFQVGLALERQRLYTLYGSTAAALCHAFYTLFPGVLEELDARRTACGVPPPQRAPLLLACATPAGNATSRKRPAGLIHSETFCADRALAHCDSRCNRACEAAPAGLGGEQLLQWDESALDPVTLDPLGADGEAVIRLPCATDAVPCTFNASTVRRALRLRDCCPSCQTSYDLPGPQPTGFMRVCRDSEPCEGHAEHDTLCIGYVFPSLVQTVRHPNPGVQYEARHTLCFYPNNEMGRRAVELLRRAFTRGLLFRVGTSATHGRENVVTFGGIHQKTSRRGGPTRHGWPDTGALERLESECAALGVMRVEA